MSTVNIMYTLFGFKQYDFYAISIMCPSTVGIVVCLYGMLFQIMFLMARFLCILSTYLFSSFIVITLILCDFK